MRTKPPTGRHLAAAKVSFKAAALAGAGLGAIAGHKLMNLINGDDDAPVDPFWGGKQNPYQAKD